MSETATSPTANEADTARRAPLGALGFALAAFILFWPTGIPAVLAAIRSREAHADGQPEIYAAQRTRSLQWSWISVGIVVAVVILYMLMVAMLIAAGLA